MSIHSARFYVSEKNEQMYKRFASICYTKYVKNHSLADGHYTNGHFQNYIVYCDQIFNRFFFSPLVHTSYE